MQAGFMAWFRKAVQELFRGKNSPARDRKDYKIRVLILLGRFRIIHSRDGLNFLPKILIKINTKDNWVYIHRCKQLFFVCRLTNGRVLIRIDATNFPLFYDKKLNDTVLLGCMSQLQINVRLNVCIARTGSKLRPTLW